MRRAHKIILQMLNSFQLKVGVAVVNHNVQSSIYFVLVEVGQKLKEFLRCKPEMHCEEMDN